MPPDRRCSHGFTLVEVMAVIAILCVVACLLFPVFANARRSALATQGASNMRQMATALAIYMDENGGANSAPLFGVAAKVATPELACDPLDTWRSSCAASNGAPLIGSYGYVPEITICCYPPDTQEWSDMVDACPDPPILVDPFAIAPPLCKWYTGSSPNSAWAAACIAQGGAHALNMGPSKYARLDTSVGIARPNTVATWAGWFSTYYSACLRQNPSPGSNGG